MGVEREKQQGDEKSCPERFFRNAIPLGHGDFLHRAMPVKNRGRKQGNNKVTRRQYAGVFTASVCHLSSFCCMVLLCKGMVEGGPNRHKKFLSFYHGTNLPQPAP